jgi:hypothetical protein
MHRQRRRSCRSRRRAAELAALAREVGDDALGQLGRLLLQEFERVAQT